MPRISYPVNITHSPPHCKEKFVRNSVLEIIDIFWNFPYNYIDKKIWSDTYETCIFRRPEL